MSLKPGVSPLTRDSDFQDRDDSTSSPAIHGTTRCTTLVPANQFEPDSEHASSVIASAFGIAIQAGNARSGSGRGRLRDRRGQFLHVLVDPEDELGELRRPQPYPCELVAQLYPPQRVAAPAHRVPAQAMPSTGLTPQRIQCSRREYYEPARRLHRCSQRLQNQGIHDTSIHSMATHRTPKLIGIG